MNQLTDFQCLSTFESTRSRTQPLTHYWLIFLDALFYRLGFRTKKEQNSAPAVICKVMIDQLFWAPLNTWAYFYQLGWLEGRTSTYISNEINKNFWNIMISNWKVWVSAFSHRAKSSLWIGADPCVSALLTFSMCSPMLFAFSNLLFTQPVLNAINFKFVPPQLRVLFGNVVAIFWLTYLMLATK